MIERCLETVKIITDNIIQCDGFNPIGPHPGKHYHILDTSDGKRELIIWSSNELGIAHIPLIQKEIPT